MDIQILACSMLEAWQNEISLIALAYPTSLLWLSGIATELVLGRS